MPLSDMRRNYSRGRLSSDQLPANPLELFDDWLQQVIDEKVMDATAMTLGTVNTQGFPRQRIVLLKGRVNDGFRFFTNYGSDKGDDIAHCPRVSLHFPWHFMERQVHIEGVAERLSDAENDEYFASRPRDSQLAARASNQSKILASRKALEDRFEAEKREFADKDIERPELWGGYHVSPVRIEFWQGGENRLHDRFVFEKENSETDWQVSRLNP